MVELGRFKNKYVKAHYIDGWDDKYSIKVAKCIAIEGKLTINKKKVKVGDEELKASDIILIKLK